MTQEEKAKQLALTLIGEDQNPQPLIEALMDMAEWQYQKDRLEFAKLKDEEWQDGFDAGAEWQKKMMMEKAIPFHSILKAVPPGPERDTTKAIIIKEEITL